MLQLTLSCPCPGSTQCHASLLLNLLLYMAILYSPTEGYVQSQTEGPSQLFLDVWMTRRVFQVESLTTYIQNSLPGAFPTYSLCLIFWCPWNKVASQKHTEVLWCLPWKIPHKKPQPKTNKTSKQKTQPSKTQPIKQNSTNQAKTNQPKTKKQQPSKHTHTKTSNKEALSQSLGLKDILVICRHQEEHFITLGL